MNPWHSEETIEVVDAHLVEADVVLAQEMTIEALVGVVLEPQEAIAKCSKPFVVIVEKIVRFLLDQQMANLFTVVSVLKKWEIPDQIQEETKDRVLGPKPQLMIQAKLN
jgi:flagellar biosynthesis component FlhA